MCFAQQHPVASQDHNGVRAADTGAYIQVGEGSKSPRRRYGHVGPWGSIPSLPMVRRSDVDIRYDLYNATFCEQMHRSG